MSSNFYPVELKYKVMMAYKRGETFSSIVSKCQISSSTIYNWINKFEKYGIDSLSESKTWKRYSKELKTAVRDYLFGKYTKVI